MQNQYSLNLGPPSRTDSGFTRERSRRPSRKRKRTAHGLKKLSRAGSEHLELDAEVSRLEYLASVMSDSDNEEEKLLAEAELFASFNATWEDLP